jgi:hypothetical protein
VTDAIVYLVPIGSGRFDLYTEPADDSAPARPARDRAGFVQRTRQRLHDRWRRALDTATHGAHGADAEPGRVARARDWAVRRIAESIAEQRTLWSLRTVTAAVMCFPANLSEASAAATRDALLSHAQRHHRIWLLANVVGVLVTAALMLLPGPNVIGYYFLFRVVGHFLSWRGATQGLERIAWRQSAEPSLAALGALADVPRDQRADRVAQLVAALGVPGLAVFFDRVACPPR